MPIISLTCVVTCLRRLAAVNQSHLASSEAVSIVNRMLQYIDWRVANQEEYNSQIELKHMILRFVNGILHGIPTRDVVTRLLRLLNWRQWSRQMHAIITAGDDAGHDDGIVESEYAVGAHVRVEDTVAGERRRHCSRLTAQFRLTAAHCRSALWRNWANL
eukprot:SAG31_NODE_845_length_11547_cov_8.098096_3_plen_160_part_00